MRDHKKHILCVDNEWDACETCQTLAILNPDLRFTFAYDCEHGFAIIRRGLFDLYLIRSWLPDGSGIDLCREIRRTDANTPVVVMIGQGHFCDHQMAIEAGASACLHKPGGLFHLESTLGALVRDAEFRSLEAKNIELRALSESIGANLAALNARVNGSAERMIRANEHLLKADAYSAFIGSGGARAHFERLWPGVLDETASQWDLASASAPPFDSGSLE